jgi:cell division protease FtsH
MVKEFGMSERMGYVTFGKEKQPLFLPSSLFPTREYSEDTAKQIDEEVKKIVDETYLRVREILTTKKDQLGELARLLLDKEVVEEADLKKILELPPTGA